MYKDIWKKSVSGSPKLYVFQGGNSSCVLCSWSSSLYFVGDKISTGIFLNEIRPLLKENYRLKFTQDVAIHHVR